MYLQSLELHGFKSFPERTVLTFNSGTTVIVGPNGSGKSNITDAMRWVLGELSTKNLRGSKMEDVIFAGADGKKPMSFAEVSVTFDDSAEPRMLSSPYTEITVTRRIYRSGDSEYFINRQKCRLKDIYELFMNTGIGREGYSIIGQGRIAEIVSKKSEDRRGVFEESAGISSFRYKKAEAEKKLAETEANMERIGDLETELENRLGPLEKEAARARQYMALYEEKKEVDIALWLCDSIRLKTEAGKSAEETRLSAHELEMAEDSLQRISAQTERLYEQSRENKETVRRLQDAITAGTRQITEAETAAQLLESERLHAETTCQAEQLLLETARKTAEHEETRLREVQAAQTAAETQYQKEQEAFASLAILAQETEKKLAGQRENLSVLRQQKEETEAASADASMQLGILRHTMQAEEERTVSVQTSVQRYADTIRSLQTQMDDAAEVLQRVRDTWEGLTEAETERNRKTAEQKKQQDETERQIRKQQAELASLDSRIAALRRMQEHFDGYNTSIRHVMQEARNGHLRGIRGPLSVLIQVEAPYLTAIETALGAAMQNLVTEDEHAVRDAIASLKQHQAGRATFYPLTTIRAGERGRDCDGVEQNEGFVRWGDELVSCEPEYRAVVRSLLGRTAVFDTLEHASAAARRKNWRLRAVTLDGQQIHAGGSFTGGQQKRDSGMLSRSMQIEAMCREREQTAAVLTDMQKRAEIIRNTLDGLYAEAERTEQEKKICGSRIREQEKIYGDADSQRTALASLCETMQQDFHTLEDSRKENSMGAEQLQQVLTDRKRKLQELEEHLTREEQVLTRLEQEKEQQTMQAGEIRIRLAEWNRDREAAAGNCRETEERRQTAAAEIRQHTDRIAELRLRITERTRQVAEKTGEAAALRQKTEQYIEQQKQRNDDGDALDIRLTSLRQTEKEQSSKKELLLLAHSKNETKLRALQEEEHLLSERMWEEYELTYAGAERFAAEHACPPPAESDRSRCRAKQAELKNQLRTLGPVHVEAVEEYRDVKKRYDYIRTQLDDLRSSRESLHGILTGIERDMKNMFVEAFARINTCFGEVFRELFGGGHAEVVLEDPEHALESGIEIQAALPGKTIRNLNLLSGGEQAFIAIALLFALLRVNPSPFCIFDEIEAALDEVNVLRMGRYVKKYADRMQIIMISHRRGTMDMADTLYGVTMQQSGVSKVFTLGKDEQEKMHLK